MSKEIDPTTQELLTNIGLDEREQAVYLTLLQSGPLSASVIARKTGLGRTYIYDIVADLMEKGLVSETKKMRIRYFIAEPAERLLDYLDTQETQLEKRKDILRSILPTLTPLYQTSTTLPKVRFYIGKEGAKAIYEDTLKGGHKEILQAVSVKNMLENPGVSYMKKYVKQRTAKGIKVKAIHNIENYIGDKANGYNTLTSQQFLREVRYPKKKVNFTSMIMIYGDKVASISTSQENFGFIVESHEFADTLREYFHALWHTSDPTLPAKYHHLY